MNIDFIRFNRAYEAAKTYNRPFTLDEFINDVGDRPTVIKFLRNKIETKWIVTENGLYEWIAYRDINDLVLNASRKIKSEL
jgi:hypothetical protein